MSWQNIPLKGRTDFRESSRILATETTVPANRMPYAGMPDAADRADLIAYLQKVSKSSGALPHGQMSTISHCAS
jgi:hypothetical protein